MERIKLTGPGLLLILAVLAGGAIFMLDAFYLSPQTHAQQRAAYLDTATRTEAGTKLLLAGELNALQRACASWAASGDLTLSPNPGASNKAIAMLVSSHAHRAWLTDASGTLVAAWKRRVDGSVADWPEATMDLGQEAAALAGSPSCSGMIRLPSGPMLAACVPLGDTASAGRLWLACPLDKELLNRLDGAVDGEVAFHDSVDLPPGVIGQDRASRSLWLKGQDLLIVAWLAHGIDGRPIGQFQVAAPVAGMLRQAAAGRRMVLLVLSLSMGLSLLVIVGAHILVTGPVVRLLRSLQRLESGEGSSKDLVRDLHGEPLMLARRLEYAFDRLAYMSRTDQLTNLANRRHFEHVLNAFYNQARRYNRPLSLIVIDVDFFKAVNDTAGHAAGDQVLKSVAGAIEQACRRADLPARFGGDEFAVLLPETGASEAQAVAERIAATVAELKIDVRNASVTVGISAGLTDLNSGEISSPEAMLALADRALYAAKERGRGRIIQAHDLTGSSLDCSAETTKKVDAMCRKLAGLDNQFKDLFVRTIEEIVHILEHRDPHMADHARKVQHFALLIGKEMELPARVLKRLEVSAMLHDIGMIAMPDTILQNPGRLTDEQFQLVRRHPLLSVRIMEQMDFLEQEIPAVRYHHERFDGNGYPEGIAGAAIPLTARILAVADTFDAMTSGRLFHPAYTPQQGIEELRAQAGKQFDPAVVDAFIAVAEEMKDSLMDVSAVVRPKLGAKECDDAESHAAPAAMKPSVQSADELSRLGAT